VVVLVYGLVDLLISYWDSEDHEYLAGLLQNYGIPIRFVGIFPDYRAYILAGYRLHVYRRVGALNKYSIPDECYRMIYVFERKHRRKALWLVVYGTGKEITPTTIGEKYVIFSIDGDIHLLTPDTSIAGFVRAVELLTSKLVEKGVVVVSCK
jgi:hypothetical protein